MDKTNNKANEYGDEEPKDLTPEKTFGGVVIGRRVKIENTEKENRGHP